MSKDGPRTLGMSSYLPKSGTALRVATLEMYLSDYYTEMRKEELLRFQGG